MAECTTIGWAEVTWNPWVGCERVSPGCKNCYMHRQRSRFVEDTTKVKRTSAATFTMPLTKKNIAGKIVFVCSWSDFFIEKGDRWRENVWKIIRNTPETYYILLTKRPENIAERLPPDWKEGYPNVAIMVSTENQRLYEKRWSILSKIPCKLKGISAEPLLEELKLNRKNPPQWILMGGETGFNPRPVPKKAFTKIVRFASKMKIPVYHRQNGGKGSGSKVPGGNLIEGRKYIQFPAEIKNHRRRFRKKPS